MPLKKHNWPAAKSRVVKLGFPLSLLNRVWTVISLGNGNSWPVFHISMPLLVPFCVQIGQLFETQWVFKHSEEFRNWWHFPSITAICRFSYILQRLTVPRIIDLFEGKRRQRSVKMWTKNLCKSFFLLYMNNRLSNIRLVTPRTVYFDWICMNPNYQETLK